MKISVVHLTRDTPLDFTRFADFAEDVFRSFKDDLRVGVDLGAVDQGSGVLVISCRVGLKGHVTGRVTQLIEQHGLEGRVRLDG